MRLIQLLVSFSANVSEGLPSAATEQSSRPSRRTTGLFDSRGPVVRSHLRALASVTGLGEQLKGGGGEDVSALYPETARHLA